MGAVRRGGAFGPPSNTLGYERVVETAAPLMPPLRPPAAAAVAAEPQAATFVAMAPAPAPVNIATPAAHAQTVEQYAAPVQTGAPSAAARPGNLRPGIGRFAGVRRRRAVVPGPVEVLPTPTELARFEDLRRPFRRPMTVLVANPKGGSGKTPLTLMLAGTLALMRGGHVLAWDNNEARGGLIDRASPRGVSRDGEGALTVRHLLSDLGRFEAHEAGMGELGAYLRPQDELFDVLASDDAAASLAQIGTADFQRLHAMLRRYYRILVLDSGNNVRSEAWQAAAAVADCLVLPSRYESDSLAAAEWTCEHLVAIGRGDLVERAVTVLSAANGRPDPSTAADARSRFAHTAAVVEIAHDPKLRAGGTVGRAVVSQATVDAVLRAAQAVVEQLCRADEPTPARVDADEPTLELARPVLTAVVGLSNDPADPTAAAEPAERPAPAKPPAPKVVAAAVATAKVSTARVSPRKPAASKAAPKAPAAKSAPARRAAPTGQDAVVAPREAEKPTSTRRIAKPRTDAPVPAHPPAADAPATTGAAASGEVVVADLPILFVADSAIAGLSTGDRS